MKCEICGTQYRKIESNLICSNGHTLQNVQEVAHEDPLALVLKKKRIRMIRKEQKILLGTGCYLTRMILFKLLFEEAIVFFKFPNDKIFQFFTGFFEFNKTKLESELGASKAEFFALIYLNRRSEAEKKNQPYFIKDVIRDFRDLDISTRILLIKNKYPSLETPCYEFLKTHFHMTALLLKRLIGDLTDGYTFPNTYSLSKHSDSGVIKDSVDKSKHNIRAMIRNDIEIAKIYFKVICEKYNIKITEELELYFEKYIYTFDPNQVFLPEYDFVLFIAAYFISKNDFKDTELESTILTDLVCPKVTFIRKMNEFFRSLEMAISPEVFIMEMNRKNIARYKPLRQSIEFIDAFKRNIKQYPSEIDKNKNNL